jgi:hypothetical protein
MTTLKTTFTKTSFIILCIILVFSGCKINYSFNGASVPIEAKTISVKYFNNNTTLAPSTLSQTFTETLKDKLISQTNLTLTNKNGDLAFEGEITIYSTSPIAIQSNDQAALNRLTITVKVKHLSVFEEKNNFEQSFSRYFDYPSSQSLSEIENDLIREINEQLVQDIYNKALNNW